MRSKARLAFSLATLIALPVAPLVAQAAKNSARQWLWFDSREKATGPRIELELASGKKLRVPAKADTVLISYLASRAYGRMPRLSLSMGDTNRVLLGFGELAHGDVAKATLVLTQHPSQIPPVAPYELAVHTLKADWSEARTSWNAQPAFDADALQTVRVDPKASELRIELGRPVASWSRGFLLKVAKPVGASSQVANPTSSALLDRVEALYDWAPSLPVALEQARKRSRLVLVLATTEGLRGKRPEQEDLLYKTVLAHPDVWGLVARYFVPVRVRQRAWAYLLPAERRRGEDPLTEVGTTLQEARAPALVVATAAGEHVATWPSLGCYDFGRLREWLHAALRRSSREPVPLRGMPASVQLMREGLLDAAKAAFASTKESTGEQRYWHAALLEREGESEKARPLLEELAKSEDPFALEASLRLAFSQRVRESKPLLAPQRSEDAPDIVRRALEHLLAQQHETGAFPVASPMADYCIPGVTVLGAQALHRWLPELRGELRARASAALQRADEWCQSNVAAHDPRTLNSFAAAYYLEYLLDRFATDESIEGRVEAAIQLLIEGACKNGAWAYDRRFGESWRGGIGAWPRTTQGRTHSCNTGPAMAALLRAKAAGFAVDASVLAAGVRALRAMRKRLGVYTYTWPMPRNFEREDSSIARAPVCELALQRAGSSTEEALRGTLALFMKHRAGLRLSVRLSKGWIPPHAFSSYFYFFAYYHASDALVALGAKSELELLRRDLLAAVLPDSTWVDYEDIGKCYGTAMALIVLHRSGLRLPD